MAAGPLDDDDLQIFGPPSDGRSKSPIAFDACGTILEDIYCLKCGYNLRGLCGDPVRCPECGDFNSLGVAAVPAEAIHRALRGMETIPTLCVAAAFLYSVFIGAALVAPGPVALLLGLLAAACGASWFALLGKGKKIFAGRPGWGRIVRDFHVAAAPCIGAIVGLTILFHRYKSLGSRGAVWAFIILAVVGAVVISYVGLKFYDAARKRLAEMQRSAAVRIAQERLRDIHVRPPR